MSTLLDALGYLGQTLDKPGASVRGLLAGRPGQLANLVPFSDTMGLTDPSQRTSGRDLLEAYGAVGPNEDGLDLGDVAGFGAELATDPLNWLGAAGLARTGMAAKSAKANNVLRDALLAKGAMPEEIAGLTKAVDASGKPVRTYHGTGGVFDTYDMGRMSNESLYGPGIYTTEHPGIASEYAAARGEPTFSPKPGRENDIIGLVNRDPRLSDVFSHLGPEDVVDDEDMLSLALEAIDAKMFLPDSPHYADLAPLFEHTLPPQNVRMQYMDLRNPFNMDVPHEVAFLPSPLNEKGLRWRPELWAAKDPNYRALQAQRIAAEAEVKKIQEAQALASLEGDYQQVQHLEDKLLDAHFRNKDIKEAMRQFEDSVSPPPGWTQTGDEIFRHLAGPFNRTEDALQTIKEAGYDSINHTGGGRVGLGKVMHNVWIGTDPSQVYAPFLAPAQKDVPRLSPLLAALGGYQAGVLPGRLGGAR